MTPTFLSIQQLRERGWTPAMIRDLLHFPDEERPNQRQPGFPVQLLDRPVALYLETRVLEAEAQEGFAQAWARGQVRIQASLKAKQVRQEHQVAQLVRYAAIPMLTLTPPPQAETWTSTNLWAYHLNDYYSWGRTHAHLLNGLPRAVQGEAERMAFERFRLAFQALYGAEDVEG